MKQINETTFTSDNGLITFIHGDCMEVMAGCRENEFDLACVDVPYGIRASDYKRGDTQYGKAKAKSKNYGLKNWDDSAPKTEYWNRLFLISKNQIVFGANHFISKIPFNSSCWIVWNKENGDNGYADCELAWTSFTSAVRMFTWRWQGMLQGNMKNKQERIHVTEKPIQLYRWIFKNYAKPTDHILDTHGGSMSSAIAAHMEGLKMTIIELDKEYFDKAIQRFANYERQQVINFE